jgi:hypothetical protein
MIKLHIQLKTNKSDSLANDMFYNGKEWLVNNSSDVGFITATNQVFEVEMWFVNNVISRAIRDIEDFDFEDVFIDDYIDFDYYVKVTYL